MVDELDRLGAEARRELTDVFGGEPWITGATVRRHAARRRATSRALAVAVLFLAASAVVVTRTDHHGRSTVVADQPTTGDTAATPPTDGTTAPTTAKASTPAHQTTPTTPSSTPTTTSSCAPQPPAESLYVSAVNTTQDGSIWVVAQQGVFVSSDAGTTWTWRCFDLPDHRAFALNHLVASDAHHAVAFGSSATWYPQGVFAITDDGGLTWVTGRLANDQFSKYLTDLEFVSPTTGWLVGSYQAVHSPAGAFIMRTTDAGRTWNAVPFPQKSVAALSAVSFLDDQHGWVASGGAGTADGQIFQTDDGGQTWTALPLGPSGPFNHVVRADATHGYAVATESAGGEIRSILLATADGGRTWQRTALPGPDHLSNVFAIGPTQAVALGGIEDLTANGSVVITTDGGTTWNTTHPDGLSSLVSASFSGPKGWASGRVSGPCVFSTDDAGRTWAKVPLIAGANCPNP